MEGVVQIKDITLVWEATGGTSTFRIYGDLPSGIAEKRTLTLANTSGERKTDTFPLDATPLDLRLIKYRAEPAAGTVLILHSGFIRFRPIGTYLSGAAGDIWETQEISFE